MKKLLNSKNKKVVNIFDEATLWSAPFGRLLLEHIPMKPKSKILDIGFGTGFPLIELSQRFGSNATIYGIDIWKEGIEKAKEKIKVLEISNIQIFEQSATSIPLENNTIDLVCSNLGVNNFEEKEKVLVEIFRVLKNGGSLCITTNVMGTFIALFDLFEEVMKEMKLENELILLQEYIAHRSTKKQIVAEIENMGFNSIKTVSDEANIRFVNALAVFNHSLIRVGFRKGWESLIPKKRIDDFFKRLIQKLEDRIKKDGEFKMSIPILYLEFRKK